LSDSDETQRRFCALCGGEVFERKDVTRVLVQLARVGDTLQATTRSLVVHACCPEKPAPWAGRVVWAHSDQEYPEVVSGCEDTREGAVAEGRATYDGDFWVFRCEVPDPAGNLPGVDWIVERMGEDAWERFGEAFKEYPDLVDGAREDLEVFLTAWARRSVKTNKWVVVGDGELVEVEAAFDAARVRERAARDDHAAALEPPGSYGLCWRDVPGGGKCVRKPHDDGPCSDQPEDAER
jgi:hypothetical protein